ncbi:MAG: glycosyltransferase [Acidobacteria bacterium]|nr:glycosyltransferase [Acidobacteriota bacterium]
MDAAIPDDGVFARIERIFHGTLRRVTGCLRAIPSQIPIQVGYYQNPIFEKRLRQMAPEHDCLLAHLIRTASYITDFEMPKVLEMTDAISMSYLRTAQHERFIRAALHRLEGRRLLNFERAVADQCDLNVLVSEVDRAFLFPPGKNRNVMVCSNGVDSSALPFQFAPDGKTIIFIGKNSTRPNMDAILFFQEEVFPLVRARLPEARFKVIGQIGSEFRRKLEVRGVIVTGSVVSVADAAAGASVGVCPLRIGAGIQNKILEYMAFGVPTVTSPLGLEGLAAVPGVHLMTAVQPSDWADKIVKLLTDRGISSPMAIAARRFVQEHHSWPAQLAGLGDSIHCLIRGSGSKGTGERRTEVNRFAEHKFERS